MPCNSLAKIRQITPKYIKHIKTFKQAHHKTKLMAKECVFRPPSKASKLNF